MNKVNLRTSMTHFVRGKLGPLDDSAELKGNELVESNLSLGPPDRPFLDP